MVVTRSSARYALTEMPEPILLAIVEALGHADRTRLAMTCKTLLHAQWGQWGVSSQITLGENWATPVKAFRRCLELHPNNFTTKIYFQGQSSMALADPPYIFDIPFQQLGCLTSLELVETAVHLPSLLCIARQLCFLTLLGISRLYTGAQPGAESDIFAAGWDSLRRLRLEGVCVDAAFEAVHLPNLERLSLLRVRIGDAHGPVYSCANAFAAGCPRCMTLEYSQPLPVTPTAGLLCKDFRRLQQLALDLRPSQIPAMSGGDWPALPTTVTSLTFGARVSEEHECLELHAMLALTAAWISAGVPLQQLCFLRCAPDESDLVSVDDQQQRFATGRHAAVCASLRGITRIQLLRSRCSLGLRNAMVAALPDLKQLSMDLDVGQRMNLPITCSGLELLELYSYFQDVGGCHMLLSLNLSDANTLRTCVIRVDQAIIGGEAVKVRIVGHDAAASIVPSVEIVRDGGGSAAGARLIISLGQGKVRRGRRRAACVTFKYNHGEGLEDAMWRALPVRYVEA